MGRILQEHRAYPGPQVDPGRPQRGGDIRRACESLQVKKGSTIQNIKKLAQRWGLTQGSGKGNPRALGPAGTPGSGATLPHPRSLRVSEPGPAHRKCPVSEG